MSDENQVDIEPVEEVQSEGQEELVQISAQEAKARSGGWVDLEEWKEQGKDPKDWSSYKFFNEKGDMISQINRLKNQSKEFDQRLSQNNEYWRAQLDIQKADLISKRNEAIDDADRDKVNAIDEQIQNINAQQNNLNQQAIPQIDPQDTIVEQQYFETLTTRPKQLLAQSVAAPLIQKGLSGQELVDAVDAEIKKEFPPQNQRRNQAESVTDTSKKSGGKKDSLTIDSLSDAERMQLKALQNVPSFKGKSEAEILKAIEDSKR